MALTLRKVRYEKKAPIAYVTIDNAEQENCLTEGRSRPLEGLAGLPRRSEALRRDPHGRRAQIVLRRLGPSGVRGGDLQAPHRSGIDAAPTKARTWVASPRASPCGSRSSPPSTGTV